MDSEALVQLALNTLSCNQKGLAALLGVSPTQISKWKKGEHISWEMEKKFREITSIGNRAPAFVLWAGSVAEAEKWESLIRTIADAAEENSETGYSTYPLRDETELLCWETISTLIDMGVALPAKLPMQLTVKSHMTEQEHENFWDLIHEHPLTNTIYEIYMSLNDVYGFYAAYINDLIYNDQLELAGTPAENIEPCLLTLAASKIDINPGFAKNFSTFKHHIESEYEKWLTLVKGAAFRNGIPLKAELMNMVHRSNDELGHEAEAESLGFNSSRLHPDVYMNELLVGMRVIHQVLPAILKKLGIENDFKLDTSELRMN